MPRLTVQPTVAGAYITARRTTGNVVLNGTSWVDVDAAIDLVVPAVIGDVIQVGVDGLWSADAVTGCLDMVSRVSAAPVNSWTYGAAEDNATFGNPAWCSATGVADAISLSVGGPIAKAVVAGDLSAGSVTLRLRGRTTTAAPKTLFAAAGLPLIVWAKNLRQ